MTDSNKKPASAASGKPAGRGAGRAASKPRKQGPGKTGMRAAAKARDKAREKAKAQGLTLPEKAPAAAQTPAQQALAWAHSARFLTTASQLKHLPINGMLPAEARAAMEAQALRELEAQDGEGFDDRPDGADAEGIDSGLGQDLPPRQLPEIAFVGRSNAGKSTAINTIAQQKRLAFASKTPGRTQHINLFAVGPKDAPDALFADLPGYGYAAVARDAKLRWQRVMADYLSERESLSGVVLMVDSRLGLTDLDKQLLEFVSDRVTAGEISLLLVLTKADKLNRKEGAAVLAQVQKDIAVLATEDSDIGITLFSALNKQGVGDVAELLYEWAHREPVQYVEDDEADEGEQSEEGDQADDAPDAAAAAPVDPDDQR